MNVSSLQNSLLSHYFSQPSEDNNPVNFAPKNTRFAQDNIALSESARELMDKFLTKQSSAALVAVPIDQRPTAQQSADKILEFIDQQLKKNAFDGAGNEELDKVLNQALEGVEKGITQASKMIERLGLMTEDIQESISSTRSLVLNGVATFRAESIDSNPVDSSAQNVPVRAVEVSTVVKQVEFYQEQRSESVAATSNLGKGVTEGRIGRAVQAGAATYTQNYRQNEAVELAVKTLDGDIITLSFSSNFASRSNVGSFLSGSGQVNGSGQALTGIQAYQNSVSTDTRFSFSVQGDLDAGETQAINDLLEQVSELAEEFFNGDFDDAIALALDFEMDTQEFSALSLDIARNTSASVVQAYAGIEDPSSKQNQQLLISGSEIIGRMLGQLKEMSQLARDFSDSKPLLTGLLANQVAQYSLTVPDFNNESITQLLDKVFNRFG